MGKLARRLKRRAKAEKPAPELAHDEASPAGGPEASMPSTARRLDALRRALARSMGTEAPKAEPVPASHVAQACLPFVACDTVEGPCPRHAQRRGDGDRVGRFPLGAALRVDPEMLAHLALDASLAGLDFRRALYLDTETTGLGSGTGNLAFLVGLARLQDDELELEQLFLEEPGDEAALLALVRERIEAAEVLVTFNGKSFDLPLLRSRYVMTGLRPPREPPHLDLLHLARRVHKGRRIRTSLTGLEAAVLGFVRFGDIAGEEVARRYLHYLRTGDASGVGATVDHNALDVWTMVALVGLYGHPLERMDDDDLPWVARTVRRSGDVDRAAEVAEEALCRDGDLVEALRVVAEIAKARGDVDRAIDCFERVDRERSDPLTRLELAKLYEHRRKDPALALACVERGVAETPDAIAHRRARLEAKLAKTLRRRPPRRLCTSGQLSTATLSSDDEDIEGLLASENSLG